MKNITYLFIFPFLYCGGVGGKISMMRNTLVTKVSDTIIQKQNKDCDIFGIWKNKDDINATFELNKNEIIYTEDQFHPHKVDITFDSLIIFFDDEVAKIKFKLLSCDSLVFKEGRYIDTLTRFKE